MQAATAVCVCWIKFVLAQLYMLIGSECTNEIKKNASNELLVNTVAVTIL